MRFLCTKCNEPMECVESSGPDEGPLAVTFGCQVCGAQFSVLTNPGETQLAASLGIEIGGGGQAPSTPMAHVRDALQDQPGGRPSADSPPGAPSAGELEWTPEAQARLQQVPDGVMRDLTRQRVERLAKRSGAPAVTVALMEEKYEEWSRGSAEAARAMVWSEEALQRMERIPPFIRGKVGEAIEAYARQKGIAEITPELMEEAKHSWEGGAGFHNPQEEP